MKSPPADRVAMLHGTQVTLRPVRDDDVEALATILAEPEIAKWWGRYDEARVRAELVLSDDPVVYAVEVDGELAGSIQYHEEPARDYRHAGIDVFLSTRFHGRGLGSDAVRTLARHLLHDRGHHRLVIDPNAKNEAAIRCYERVGFRRVGLMRAYERGPDGSWHDCYMLEALKGEIS